MSPVTGVLIMVGVVMVLTVAIIVTVSLMGPDEEPAPEMSFSFNETGQYAEVDEHSPGLSWDGLQVSMDRAGRFALAGGPVHEADTALMFLTVDDDRSVQEGDRIHFCLDDGEGALQVTIRDYRSGEVVDRGSITQVAQCPEIPRQGPDAS